MKLALATLMLVAACQSPAAEAPRPAAEAPRTVVAFKSDGDLDLGVGPMNVVEFLKTCQESAGVNFTYTKAIQESGPTAGLDVPFYSRITDTLGLRYETHGWTFDVSTMHQSSQFSDVTNTVNETPDARVGRIPGFRVWNMQADWKIPGWKGSNLTLGVNNIADKRYYTRNVDGNAGRMVGAPRLIYVQGHFVY